MTAPTMPPRIDLSELAKEDDPYPTYERLRQAGPISRAGPNQWLVTRYREVTDLLQDSSSLLQFQVSAVLKQFPSNAEVQSLSTDPAVEFTERILAGRDGVDHGELRQQMARALKPALADLDRMINFELDEIIEKVRARRAFDVVEDIAFPLPLRVLGRIIGIPQSLQHESARRALKLTRVFSPDYGGVERREANEAIVWLRECILEILSHRAKVGGPKSGGDDFLGRLSGSQLTPWSRADVVDNIVFLLFAGFETSLNLIACGFDALLEWPDEQRRLRNTPSLSPLAIEEFLRFNSPVHITGRVTRQPTVIADHRIGRGRIVYLALASANRDPGVFDHPDRLDIGRMANRHVAFGAGPHSCLGAAVARREAIVTFGRVATELGWLERTGERVRAKSATLRSIHRLAVSIES